MKAYEKKLDGGVRLIVEVVSEKTFRVRLIGDRDRESALNRYGIIQALPDVPFETVETAEQARFKTAAAELTVKSDGSVRLKDASGRALLESAAAPVKARDGGRLSFLLNPGTRLYGLGDVTRERVEKTGFSTEIWVENVKEYVPIPFMLSSEGWGLFLNTTWRHTIDAGSAKADELRADVSGGELDCYLFAGQDVEDILNEYTNLTGKPAMLPVWAYGLVYVCNEHVNAIEMMQECLNFRREGIPCDVCGLEPGWMSKYYDFSTEKKWDPDRFPIPYWAPKGDQTFFGALSRLGFKLSLWLCCDYDLSYEEERQARRAEREKAGSNAEQTADDFEQDRHFGARGKLSMDRVTKIDEAWFEHLKPFVDQGASCFKLDGANQIVDHPDRKWGNGMDDEEMHNLYPLIYNKQMSRGFSDYTHRRSMIYSSGGYAGIQQFGATWAGDTGGGPKPLVSMLNHGYSGHVNTSCDMDVFSAGGIHFGFFQPWSQLCNWAYWRQPWFLTPDRRDMYRFYANLRYRLLPYIYSMAHRAAQTGYPLMRAMSMAFPTLENADALLYEYMFGDDLLTAAFAEEMVLPEGRWYDAWTNAPVEGGRTIPAVYPDSVGGPLYVREGAVIPTCESGDFTGQKPMERIELNIYPGHAPRRYAMYEDDGVSLAYLKGESAETRIDVEPFENGVTVRVSPRRGRYDGMPEKRVYAVNLMTVRSAKAVTVNGRTAVYAVRTDGWCRPVGEGFISVPAEENGHETVVTVTFG